MQFGQRAIQYLKEMEAVFVEAKYKITQIDFDNLKAHVNKFSYYKKRNGKICYVEHKFGKWISFPKEFVRYGEKTITGETNDWSVGDREQYSFQVKRKYLTKESKQQIINTYLSLNN